MTPAVPLVLNSYANLLLMIATALYLVYVGWRSQLIGLLATCAATLGAAGLTLSLCEQWLHPASATSSYSAAFILALFSAVTVIAYLVMEKWYDSKTTGAFVMPVVAVAVSFESLGGTSHAITAEHSAALVHTTGTQLFVLASISFIWTCAVAALYGAIYLWRARRQRLMFAPLSGPQFEQKMFQAMRLGFALYTLLLLMRIPCSALIFVDDWVSYLYTFKLLAIWCFYLLYQILHGQFRWHGHFMAWCAIIGFFLSLTFIAELRALCLT